MDKDASARKPAWDWARWPGPPRGRRRRRPSSWRSFFLPWWKFSLYAPQYPSGLTLVISLTGMGGDVSEIDLLNHYIGMKHLAGAAPMERHLAGYGVAFVAVLTLVMLAVAGKKLNKLVAIPALAFPLGFLADSFYWLYTFGHQLDPKAPLHIGAFTPQMFGNGQIGQFETFAQPRARLLAGPRRSGLRARRHLSALACLRELRSRRDLQHGLPAPHGAPGEEDRMKRPDLRACALALVLVAAPIMVLGVEPRESGRHAGGRRAPERGRRQGGLADRTS